ncbi:hypothetical protein PsYK624_159280 [Phanerochaete sordida]|uniref:DUF7881 domain-containing protein n=1 Tax=Phanerochaete sordida TaxID=48140 RepID=A0A9P3LMT7_9APHY|nr:hypothetical protein PsYK624_159280 [Phanerochaete sordida]
MDDRAAYRNVHVFDASDRERLLGGLNQNGSITEANFLDMLAILLVAHFPIKVQDRFSCHEVRRSESALQPGIYDVTCKGPIALTDEPWLPRLVCPPYTDPAFSDAVLARDGRCALSGAAGSRLTTEAAYIFPCDNEDHWLAHGLAQCVADMPGRPARAKLAAERPRARAARPRALGPVPRRREPRRRPQGRRLRPRHRRARRAHARRDVPRPQRRAAALALPPGGARERARRR